MKQKLLNNLFFILTGSILFITVILVVLSIKNDKELYVFGYKPYLITSESMYPYLKLNSIVIVKKYNFNKIKEKDVIAFNVNESKVNGCHRVKEISEDGFLTRGDNNKFDDEKFVTQNNFIGKVVFKTNSLCGYLDYYNRKGIVIALVIPLIVLIAFILGIKAIISKKKNET